MRKQLQDATKKEVELQGGRTLKEKGELYQSTVDPSS